MTKAKLTRIPKRVLACVLAVLMVLSCLTMLPLTGFAQNNSPAQLESPTVVQDGNTYYAFGNNGKWYQSGNMATWNKEDDFGFLGDKDEQTAALAEINDLYSHLGQEVALSDLSSPEVVQFTDGGKWYLYLSIMKGSTSMIVVGTSDNIQGPYSDFQKVLETGFKRSEATDVLQGYFNTDYTSDNIPAAVKGWGKGSCYYYSNFLGLNYQWFTEELPRAYAPSITQYNGEYYMAYGYRNGGIWLHKLNTDGSIDFTWSGNNWNNACSGESADDKRNSSNHYLPDEVYDTAEANTHRFDPYFGQLIAHTTEGGDTDTLLSSVDRAGEEPELYAANGKLYLQVTYGGPDNGDGYNVRSYVGSTYTVPDTSVTGWNWISFKMVMVFSPSIVNSTA